MAWCTAYCVVFHPKRTERNNRTKSSWGVNGETNVHRDKSPFDTTQNFSALDGWVYEYEYVKDLLTFWILSLQVSERLTKPLEEPIYPFNDGNFVLIKYLKKKVFVFQVEPGVVDNEDLYFLHFNQTAY